jgi:hypothetical protein
MKTTNNCYVAQKNLYSKPDITYLDPCGPIPLLEIRNHNNENGTSDVNKRDHASGSVPELAQRAARYLENVTIGEEYSYCRSCADDPCEVEKTYQFNQEVWIQCMVNTNQTTWWSLTTVSARIFVLVTVALTLAAKDFCYVKHSDLWQTPEGDCKSQMYKIES